jgi:voltage-gated potassium channel Kch
LNVEKYFKAYSFWKLYINNLYFSLATFVTVGYGDVSATYFYDIIFVIIIMVISIIHN